MDVLLAARAQMAVSLGFHMVFAALGIGMPLLMAISEGLWLATGKPHYRVLAQTWSKATALTFAIGAVSGTALAFELGLLWPGFMRAAGATIGPAFVLEAWAFFVEAIFLGLYVYGWQRLRPVVHWLVGLPVAVSGLASGVLVVAANAWMQTPVGLEPDAPGDPLLVFKSPSWFHLALHSSLACYAATAFAAAGVYAAGWLAGRRDARHRSALRIAMAVGTVAAIAMPLTGDHSAKAVARSQPLKLAAMESHFVTGPRAPLILGGIPDPDTRTVRGGLELPGLLSWLAHGDVDATVTGLDAAPRELWPNVVVCHLAFQVMVAGGGAMLLAAAWFVLAWSWPRFERRGLWRLLVVVAPLGFVSLEAGWIVTEVGRQPWIVHGVLRTADAVTPRQHVLPVFVGFVTLYLVLGVTLAWLLVRLRARERADAG